MLASPPMLAAGPAHLADDRPPSTAQWLGADLLPAELRAGMTRNEVLVLDAVVNQQPGGAVFVHDGPDGIAIDEASLLRWRIEVPAGAVREFERRRYVALAALPGARATVDAPNQRLLLTLPPALFTSSAVAFDPQRRTPLSPPPWAVFANYELFGYASASSSYGSAWFELGTSGPYGSGVATAVSNSSQFGGGTTGRTVLLDASWRVDDPVRARTAIVGTAISRSGAWGRSIRFGGLQYGTNFSLQPDLITYPLPALAGTAVVPSTVDVLVNGTRVGSQQVPAGPFTISNVPVVTGSGDVQLIVRDAFGRQQILAQPFYASRQLLKPGLDDVTLSAGAVRTDYGSESFGYGSGTASAYWRRGVSDAVTVELRAEGDNRSRAAGAAVDFVPGLHGLATLGAAGSTGTAGVGSLGIVGYQYQEQRFNIAARGTWASPEFRMPGDEDLYRLQRMAVIGAGYNFGAAGSLGVGWVNQQLRSQPEMQSATLSYSRTLASRAFFSLSLSRTTGATQQTSAFATISFVLDSQTSASADASTVRYGDRTRTVAGVTAQRSLPIGEGWGYRVRAASEQLYEAGAAYAGPYGRYGIDIGSAAGSTAARASIAGGVGMLGGTVFAARPIVDSFGLVRIDGASDVKVYQNGSFAGSTNRDGIVVLTQMYPYAPNRITIDDQAVPIGITLKAREITVAPYFRSGVIVDFDARRLINATVEVRLPDGRPLPSGAEVRRPGEAYAYPVGADGEVFIPDLSFGVPYVADWAGGRCHFSVPAPVSDPGTMPRLGPLDCAASKE
jgi:outer membrane usher protein